MKMFYKRNKSLLLDIFLEGIENYTERYSSTRTKDIFYFYIGYGLSFVRYDVGEINSST